MFLQNYRLISKLNVKLLKNIKMYNLISMKYKYHYDVIFFMDGFMCMYAFSVIG